MYQLYSIYIRYANTIITTQNKIIPFLPIQFLFLEKHPSNKEKFIFYPSDFNTYYLASNALLIIKKSISKQHKFNIIFKSICFYFLIVYLNCFRFILKTLFHLAILFIFVLGYFDLTFLASEPISEY